MDFGISTRCFGTTSLTPDLLQRLRQANFSIIELHATLPGFPYQSRGFIRSIAAWFADNELPAPSLHLPFAENLIGARPFDRQRALDEIKRCLELTDLLTIHSTVLHLGMPGESFHPVLFDHAYAAISTIQAFAGVRVLAETLSNDVTTFDRIVEFRTAAQISDLGICYDTGHGEMAGAADAVHLNDNNGAADEHLWPFEASRNWPALIEKIVLSSFEGRLILEGSDDHLDKASAARSRLQDLIDEAKNSIEEFRLKYKLPAPRQEDEE